MTLLTGLSAATIQIISLYALLLIWRSSGTHAVYKSLCWLAMLLALALWCVAAGWETGVIAGLCVPAPAAWLIIILHADHRRKMPSSAAQASVQSAASFRSTSLQGKALVLQTLLRLVLAIFISLVAALAFAIALTKILDLGIETAMASAILLLPLLWGIAAWWAAADDKLWRPACGLILITVLSGLAIVS